MTGPVAPGALGGPGSTVKNWVCTERRPNKLLVPAAPFFSVEPSVSEPAVAKAHAGVLVEGTWGPGRFQEDAAESEKSATHSHDETG